MPWINTPSQKPQWGCRIETLMHIKTRVYKMPVGTCKACWAKEGWWWWKTLTHQHVCWGRGPQVEGWSLSLTQKSLRKVSTTGRSNRVTEYKMVLGEKQVPGGSGNFLFNPTILNINEQLPNRVILSKMYSSVPLALASPSLMGWHTHNDHTA